MTVPKRWAWDSRDAPFVLVNGSFPITGALAYNFCATLQQLYHVDFNEVNDLLGPSLLLPPSSGPVYCQPAVRAVFAPEPAVPHAISKNKHLKSRNPKKTAT